MTTDAAKFWTAFPAPIAWLARRLVVPALAAAALVEAFLILAWGATLLYSVPLHERGNMLPPFGLLTTGIMVGIALLFVIGFGLLLFGLPAGYLVARLRLGFGASLAGLGALGGLAGAALVLSVMAMEGGLRNAPLILAALAGVSGAATAAVWTAINADLFRKDDGA